MPKSTQQVNLDLEDLLVSKGYEVTSRDSSGKEVPTADTGEIQQFHFHRDGKDYGTVTISIDGLKNMTVYYDDEIANSGVNEDDMDGDRGMNGTSWISLVKQLKKFAQRHQLGFVLKDADRLRIDMKRRKQTEKELREGAVKELDMDLKDKKMSAEEFQKKYKMTRAEARAELSLKPKKVAEAGNKPIDRQFPLGTGDTRTPRDIKSQMRGASDRFVQQTADGKPGRFNSKVAKMQNKMAKSELRKRADHDRMATGTNEGVMEGSSKRDQKDIEAIKAAIARLESQLKHPNADKADIQQSIAHEKKRLALYGKDLSEGSLNESDKFTSWYDWKDQAKSSGYTIAKKNDKIVALNKQGQVVGHWSDLGRFLSGKAPRPNFNASMRSNMKLDEGYYGNRKMSYSDDTPQVKMIIKHNKQIEETDQRFRHIEKIFLETSDGERFGVPTNKPSRARMFARHIAEGGGYKDERWNHIAEISEDIDNLGGFIRATRSSDQFTESAQRMIGEAVDKYHELRETAKRLQGGRGYNSYFESYEPAVENDNDDDLLEVFKHSSVDSRIEKAMPTLNKLGIRRGKLEEADMFEQWADSIIDESLDIGGDRQSRAIIELFSDELPVGPNAEVAIGELSDIIEDDTLFDRLRRAASVDPNSDARPQIIAWMQEQEDPEYRELLSKLDIGEENSEEAEIPKPETEQPEEPQPEEPTPEPQDDETLPMKETDNSLKNIKRLSGL